MTKGSYTAILEEERNMYVALCPELDVTSQGATVEEATANIQEAVELFFECADPTEIAERTVRNPECGIRELDSRYDA